VRPFFVVRIKYQSFKLFLLNNVLINEHQKGDDMKEKLYRSRKQRVIAGISGGLGDFFNIDPVIIRILFVVFTVFHGSGILIYFILWVAIPEEPFEIAYGIKNENENSSEIHTSSDQQVINDEQKRQSPRIISGTILIAVGLIFLFNNLIPSFDLSDVFPFILIILGAVLILNSAKK